MLFIVNFLIILVIRLLCNDIFMQTIEKTDENILLMIYPLREQFQHISTIEIVSLCDLHCNTFRTFYRFISTISRTIFQYVTHN